MASAFVEIFQTGRLVEIDLLMRIPTDSNSMAWIKPGWAGYRSAFAPIEVWNSQLPGGLAFRVQTQFLASSGVWRIEAAAMTYQGSILAVCPLLSPQFATSATPFPVQITGILNPVQA